MKLSYLLVIPVNSDPTRQWQQEEQYKSRDESSSDKTQLQLGSQIQGNDASEDYQGNACKYSIKVSFTVLYLWHPVHPKTKIMVNTLKVPNKFRDTHILIGI